MLRLSKNGYLDDSAHELLMIRHTNFEMFDDSAHEYCIHSQQLSVSLSPWPILHPQTLLIILFRSLGPFLFKRKLVNIYRLFSSGSVDTSRIMFDYSACLLYNQVQHECITLLLIQFIVWVPVVWKLRPDMSKPIMSCGPVSGWTAHHRIPQGEPLTWCIDTIWAANIEVNVDKLGQMATTETEQEHEAHY